MKKSKILVPAMAVLLLSTAASVTGTVAWFSTNTTVTASTMTMKASAGANLYIAKGASVAIASLTDTAVSDLGTEAKTLSPCDMSASAGTVTVQVPATYSTDPTVSTAGSAATWTTVGTVTNTAATASGSYVITNYVCAAWVTIARKQTTAATFDLTATATITMGAANNLNKCIRAGYIINDVFYESGDNGIDTAGDASFTFSASPSALADNTAYSVGLMVWYEGEDSDCTTNNAVDCSTNTVSWSFTSADHA